MTPTFDFYGKTSTAEAVDPYEIGWGSGYRLNESAFANVLGSALTARQVDLLDIAMATYTADRLTARRALRSRSEQWHRPMDLQIAVREPDFWSQTPVSSVLCQLLRLLTDDAWDLTFTDGREPFRTDVGQLTLFRRDLRDPLRVGLFSGGLDSFAGAARDLEDWDGDLVLVSAAMSNWLAGLQRRAAARLSPFTATGSSPRHVQVQAGLRVDTAQNVLGMREAPERTQRTRGLVFLSFGAVGAMAAGVSELRVYENGVGAMNLPLNEAQYGSHNTRAMRPETLVLAAQLFSLVNGKRFEVVNPSFALTKARMCESLPPQLQRAVIDTISCDTGSAHRATKKRRCGKCTSCLLRRQSLRASGLLDQDTWEAERYRFDVFDTRDLNSRNLLPLHHMLDQVAQFDRALRSGEPERQLLERFPDLRAIHGALTTLGYAKPAELTRRLLATYTDEWRSFDHPLLQRYLASDTELDYLRRTAA